MNQIERVEKATEIFQSKDIDRIMTEIPDVLNEYLNEHLSGAIPLEIPFLIFLLEKRIEMFSEDLNADPRLMNIYNILKCAKCNSVEQTVTVSNMFVKKGGK